MTYYIYFPSILLNNTEGHKVQLYLLTFIDVSVHFCCCNLKILLTLQEYECTFRSMYLGTIYFHREFFSVFFHMLSVILHSSPTTDLFLTVFISIP